MILEIIFYAVMNVASFFAQWMPGAGEVPLKLPWGIDDIMVAGIQGYKVLAQAFPPFQSVLNAFVIYILFRIGLRLLRAVPILGRTLED